MKNLYTITFDSDSTDDESSNQRVRLESKSSSNAPNSNARVRQIIRHPKTKVTTINLSEESKRKSYSSMIDSSSYSSTDVYSDSYEKSNEQNSNKTETKIMKRDVNCDSPDISGNIEPKQAFRRHLKSSSKPPNLPENQKANSNEHHNNQHKNSNQKNDKTEKTANSNSNQNDTHNNETKKTEKIESNDNETNQTSQTVKSNNETVQTANIDSNNNETGEAENVSSNQNNNENENLQQNDEPFHFQIIRKMKSKSILNKKNSFTFTDSSNNCFFEAKSEKGSHSIINIFGGSHYEQLCSQTPTELKSIINSTNGQLGVVICSPEMDSFSLRLNNQYGKEMMSVRINTKKCKNSSSSVFADQKGITRSEMNPNFDLNGNLRLLKVNFFIKGINNDMKLQNIESYGKQLDFGQRSALQSTKNFILVDTLQTEMIAVRKTEKNSLCVDFQPSIPAICAFTIGLIAFLYKV